MNDLNKKKVYTVSEIVQRIKLVLEQDIGIVWLEGEISNFKFASSGHMYMDLKDKDALISLVVFRSLGSALKFKLENGQKVLVSGSVTAYKGSSKYQVIADYIEPLGAGALQLAFEQLKEKLASDGLFEREHKKPVPYLPKRIGVVTSPTGAAIRDILSITERRCELSSVLLNPVAVQGEGSAQQIAEAIDLFNKLDNVDVIIAGRGGGSLEDLWAFNEEVVARSIYNSKIPVISAVGHEIDFTIADFVADLRAPTPSAAAELVVPDVIELKQKLNSTDKTLYNIILKILDYYKNRVSSYKTHYVFKEPAGIIKNYIQRIDELDIRMKNNMKFFIQNVFSRLKANAEKLDALSPLRVMGRGYSITLNSETGHVIKSVRDVNDGQTIKNVLQDGEILSICKKN